MRYLSTLAVFLLVSLWAAAAEARPSFIVVTLDDATPSLVRTAMPRTAAITNVDFRSFFVEDALCAPSRATFLTGQYAHNNGVHVCEITRADSGYQAMRRVEGRTLAVWLQHAGYRTALVGKYMNGYKDILAIPQGWSQWFGLSSGNYFGWQYRLNENGVARWYGTGAANFMTDVLADKAVHFVQTAREPFFLYFAPISGHFPCDYAPRHAALYAGAHAPGPRETDLSDKPFMQRYADPPTQSDADAKYRDCLRSLVSADEAVQGLWNAAPPDTWLIVWSDNGFHYGEHGLPMGKTWLYDTDLHVPLMVRGPNSSAHVESRLVSNADFAPTILELAGVGAGATLDGMSFMPLLRGQSPPWRVALPGRHWAAPSRGQDHPGQTGVRTTRWKWIEWSTGDRELYDLGSDPNELQNLARTPSLSSIRSQLSDLAHRLAACSGAACRQ